MNKLSAGSCRLRSDIIAVRNWLVSGTICSGILVILWNPFGHIEGHVPYTEHYLRAFRASSETNKQKKKGTLKYSILPVVITKVNPCWYRDRVITLHCLLYITCVSICLSYTLACLQIVSYFHICLPVRYLHLSKKIDEYLLKEYVFSFKWNG